MPTYPCIGSHGSGRIRSMKRRTLLEAMPLAVFVPGGILQAMESARAPVGDPQNSSAMQDSTVVYELRVYHAYPGKLQNLLARFRDHTMKIFEKHGIKNVAYWTALDEPAKSTMLYYILQHPSREAAAANWKAFQDDPEWKSVKEQSEANGKLVENVESTFLTLTDFSPRLP